MATPPATAVSVCAVMVSVAPACVLAAGVGEASYRCGLASSAYGVHRGGCGGLSQACGVPFTLYEASGSAVHKVSYVQLRECAGQRLTLTIASI